MSESNLENLSNNYIDEVLEFAKNLTGTDKYSKLNVSLYTDGGRDDCGRQNQLDIRAYYERFDEDDNG